MCVSLSACACACVSIESAYDVKASARVYNKLQARMY